MRNSLLLPVIRFFLGLHTLTYKIISVLAIKISHGLHPKHRLIKYHHFFLAHLLAQDRVLDIGCGNGFLTSQLARRVESVTGIDQNPQNIAFAKKNYSAPNITYLTGDVTQNLPSRKFTVIILSNVLEHIPDRIAFLTKIQNLAPKILIRVPLYSRDWLTLYKKELGLEWRLDKTHHIEYTPRTLRRELGRVGIRLTSYSINFGEIWAVAVSK